ncbi:hypothetical protein D9V32_07575 [Mycetocola tolaasinivorans]|uniref:Large extracellular alpha-helical protein n=1 Tax=Mycetocola tolaasinivorans TaxID=76635 RepID=A0A3L7A770_9MICO|nr:DUF5719 family protein [Mycetocola tolaasinivorans]RLP76007.1 hypothetical protein D9V32_07575 [Mycetocola tolaasinivorans]
MVSPKRIAIISGRVIAGALGVGLVGVLAVGLTSVTIPSVSAKAPSVQVHPTAAAQTRVCTGPLLQPGESGGQATVIGGGSTVVSADSDPSSTPLTNSELSGTDQGSATALRIPVEGSTTPLIAAAQSQAVGLPELSGFAASACAEPVADAWLVAGSTATGRTSLITLANPGTADANVVLEIFGESGRVDAPGADGIIVRAGSQKVVPLASLAPGVEKPIIHVSTRGGHVLATLQQSSVRGLTPSGVELVGPAAAPALTQYIPGVVIPETPAEIEGDDTYDDRATALRLMVPGTVDAQVKISFVNESGGTAPMSLDATVPAGEVHEIFLANLPAGTFGVSVESDQPVVGGVRVTASNGSDFAWFTSTVQVGDSARIAIAPGENPRLHLGNRGDADARVTLTPADGEPIEVTVPAGGGASVPVTAGAGYVLAGAGDVLASVSYAGPNEFSSFTVQPASPGSSTVTVYPR